ncbi:hypothetical protein [Agrococcus jejuensis]|uniref:Uncharacterized protein n=1 Tax=Agrococcus jejuensis TaxID=399736 RepID=A0A1G8A414_9MICO|nr:hypothetical protein [Agrococcus jejuensis]SDH15725.1 hypothetical protein SAMN04489720_0241 [Agrococcus jejuensis]
MRIASVAPVLAAVAALALAGCASAADDDAPASSAPPTSAAPSETPTPSPSTDEEQLDPYLTEIQSVDPVAYFAFYATLPEGQPATHDYTLEAPAGSHVVRFSCASVDGSGVEWTLTDAASGAEVATGTSTCAQEAEPGTSAPAATESSPVEIPGPVAISVASTGTVSGAVGLVPAG